MNTDEEDLPEGYIRLMEAVFSRERKLSLPKAVAGDRREYYKEYYRRIVKADSNKVEQRRERARRYSAGKQSRTKHENTPHRMLGGKKG